MKPTMNAARRSERLRGNDGTRPVNADEIDRRITMAINEERK
jgi:hypothetical protein